VRFKYFIYNLKYKAVVLTRSAQEDEDVFYNCKMNHLSLWQAFLLLLWSFSMFFYKICESLQTLMSAWLTQSFKQFDLELPIVVELNQVPFEASPRLEHKYENHEIQDCLLSQMQSSLNIF